MEIGNSATERGMFSTELPALGSRLPTVHAGLYNKLLKVHTRVVSFSEPPFLGLCSATVFISGVCTIVEVLKILGRKVPTLFIALGSEFVSSELHMSADGDQNI